VISRHVVEITKRFFLHYIIIHFVGTSWKYSPDGAAYFNMFSVYFKFWPKKKKTITGILQAPNLVGKGSQKEIITY